MDQVVLLDNGGIIHWVINSKLKVISTENNRLVFILMLFYKIKIKNLILKIIIILLFYYFIQST